MAQLAELQRFLATAEGLAPDLNPINLTSNTTLALALTVALTLTRCFARPARADRAAAWHGPFPIRALHYLLCSRWSARAVDCGGVEGRIHLASTNRRAEQGLLSGLLRLILPVDPAPAVQ